MCHIFLSLFSLSWMCTDSWWNKGIVTDLVEELTPLNTEKDVYPIRVNTAGFCLLFQKSAFTAITHCIHQHENRMKFTMFALWPNWKKTTNQQNQKNKNVYEMPCYIGLTIKKTTLLALTESLSKLFLFVVKLFKQRGCVCERPSSCPPHCCVHAGLM